MYDNYVTRIEKLYSVYNRCKEDNNEWGISYWGGAVMALMRKADRDNAHNYVIMQKIPPINVS